MPDTLTVSISKVELRWLAGLFLTTLLGAGSLVWRASAILTRFEALESRVGEMVQSQQSIEKDLFFVRAGKIGPLRSGR